MARAQTTVTRPSTLNKSSNPSTRGSSTRSRSLELLSQRSTSALNGVVAWERRRPPSYPPTSVTPPTLPPDLPHFSHPQAQDPIPSSHSSNATLNAWTRLPPRYPLRSAMQGHPPTSLPPSRLPNTLEQAGTLDTRRRTYPLSAVLRSSSKSEEAAQLYPLYLQPRSPRRARVQPAMFLPRLLSSHLHDPLCPLLLPLLPPSCRMPRLRLHLRSMLELPP